MTQQEQNKEILSTLPALRKAACMLIISTILLTFTPLIAEEAIEVSPAEYWSLWALGRLKEVREEREFISASAWIPPHGGHDIRVRKEKFGDRSAKLEGYRHAVSVLILDGISLRQVQGKNLDGLMTSLSNLTHLSYRSREEWIEWWERNKDHLALSSDGTHLIVSNRKN